MTQIRITQPGMENLTGFLGDVEFKDGFSVGVVSRRQAHRLRGTMKIETLDGKDPGLLAEIANKRQGLDAPVAFDEPEEVVVESKSDLEYDYTRESLMSLADKNGLTGLRVFAEPFGAKSNSILGLVDKLMELKA